MTIPDGATITLREMMKNGNQFVSETRNPGDSFKVRKVVGGIVTGNWTSPGPGFYPNVWDLPKFSLPVPAWVQNERERKGVTV